MERGLIDAVLGCPGLPSLPAVAARIVELTADPALPLATLAEAISADAALAAKVLRTANSSLYGLRHKCTTLQSATVMLGLSTVKSISLGFSLVSAVRFRSDGFDAAAYWRRSVYSAVAARVLAGQAGKPFAEEVFLGGLLQNIGVAAMYATLGERYTSLIRATEGDHRRLCAIEVSEFEIGHPELGAILATRWRLPEELVIPIRYHERPTAAPSWCADRTRCIALANVVHDVLTDADPSAAGELLLRRAREWFGLSADAVSRTISLTGAATAEMSALLELDTGPAADTGRLLKAAAERQAAPPEPAVRPGAWDGRGLDALIRGQPGSDPITGTLRRRSFDTIVTSAFNSASARHGDLSVVQVHIDGFAAIVAARGMAAADEVLVSSAALLRRHFAPMGGVVGRWAEDTFAIAIQGRSQADILRAASEFRAAIERASLAWTIATDSRPLAVTASIGAANFDSSLGGFARGEQLVAAALRAVEESRASGGNCVRTYAPRRQAA